MNKPLPPGQELDALIAEKVFGRRAISRTVSVCSHFGKLDKTVAYLENGREVPPYSTDIASAWSVVEKLGLSVVKEPRGWRVGDLDIGQDEDSEGNLVDYVHWNKAAFSKSAPHAICLAALKAAGEG